MSPRDGDSEVPTTARRPERGPTRAERRAEATQMVLVLGQALATQIARLEGAADPLPNGWWFAPGR